MDELDETLEDKNLEELQDELQYQIKQGSDIDGTVCSEIMYRIAILKRRL